MAKQNSQTYLFNKSKSFWLAIIIFVAVTLRVGAALYLGDQVVILPGTSDQASYDMLAQRVVGGHGFTTATSWWPATRANAPTAHWSYLYTLYLSTIYGLFGYHPLVARVVQAILAGILMPWLLYRLGKRHFGEGTGLIAAGLISIYIYFIYYAAALMTETFYIISILWSLDVAGKIGQASEHSGTRLPRFEFHKRWLMLGLALSITILFRQVFLLFIPVLFLWLLWRSYQYQARSVWQMLGILIGATAIIIASVLPWTIRNYRAFDTFVLLNTNAGFAFFWGNHPIHGYNFISILPSNGPTYRDLLPAEVNTLNEGELDRALLKRGLAFIVEEPVRYLSLSVTRARDYFKFWPSSDSGRISNASRFFSFGIFLPFMLFGFIYYFRRLLLTETLILYLFVVTYTGIHLLSWALIRYRLPVDAILLIFAAAAIVKLGEKLPQKFVKNRHKPDYNIEQR